MPSLLFEPLPAAPLTFTSAHPELALTKPTPPPATPQVSPALSRHIILQNNPDPAVQGDLSMAQGKRPGTVDIFYKKDPHQPANRVATITPGTVDTFTVQNTKGGVVIDETMPNAHQACWNFPGSSVVDKTDGSRVVMPPEATFRNAYQDAWQHLNQAAPLSTPLSSQSIQSLVSIQSVCPMGGQATRLRPISSVIPKPALPINPSGLTLMKSTLGQLRHVDQIHVTTQMKPEDLKSAIEELTNVQQVHEGDTPLGDFGLIAKTLVKLRDKTPLDPKNDPAIDLNKPLLMVNGDAYISGVNFADMLAQHTGHHAGLSILTREVPLEQASQFGILSAQPMNDPEAQKYGLKAISAFTEKPDKTDSTLASTGIVLLSPEVLKAIPRIMEASGIQPTDKVNLGQQIIPALIKELNAGKIVDGDGNKQMAMAQPIQGIWLDVGNAATYLALYRFEAGLNHSQPLPWPGVIPHPEIRARGNVLIRPEAQHPAHGKTVSNLFQK
jgi:NDP-sugar pyrophosphorylase family protein